MAGSERQAQQVTHVVSCIECGDRDDRARGWRAYVDPDDREVYVYCADCAAREFADD
jgi:hypothetical protein